MSTEPTEVNESAEPAEPAKEETVALEAPAAEESLASGTD